jgi:hypothetical protein
VIPRDAGRRYPLSRVTNEPTDATPIASDSTAPDVAPFAFGENGPGLTCGGTGTGRDRALMGMRARQQYRSDRMTLARCCRGWLVLARNRAASKARHAPRSTVRNQGMEAVAASVIAVPPSIIVSHSPPVAEGSGRCCGLQACQEQAQRPGQVEFRDQRLSRRVG